MDLVITVYYFVIIKAAPFLRPVFSRVQFILSRNKVDQTGRCARNWIVTNEMPFGFPELTTRIAKRDLQFWTRTQQVATRTPPSRHMLLQWWHWRMLGGRLGSLVAC